MNAGLSTCFVNTGKALGQFPALVSLRACVSRLLILHWTVGMTRKERHCRGCGRLASRHPGAIGPKRCVFLRSLSDSGDLVNMNNATDERDNNSTEKNNEVNDVEGGGEEASTQLANGQADADGQTVALPASGSGGANGAGAAIGGAVGGATGGAAGGAPGGLAVHPTVVPSGAIPRTLVVPSGAIPRQQGRGRAKPRSAGGPNVPGRDRPSLQSYFIDQEEFRRFQDEDEWLDDEADYGAGPAPPRHRGGAALMDVNLGASRSPARASTRWYPEQYQTRYNSPPRRNGQEAMGLTYREPRQSAQDGWYSDFARPGEPDFRASRAPPGTEHVSDRVRIAAIAGEFVNLFELLPCIIEYEFEEVRTVVDEAGCLNFRPVKPRRTITTSFKWLEAWCVYELLLVNARGVSVFNEMASYRNFMISLFTKFKFPFVLTYDMRHRQLLGASRSLNFSFLNNPLYVTTFDSNSLRTTARCARCNSTEHDTASCPFRAPGQATDLPRPSRRQGERSGNRQYGDRQSGDSSGGQLCYQFQEGKCRAGGRCPRKHVCMGCGGPDGFRDCTKCKPKLASGSGTKN